MQTQPEVSVHYVGLTQNLLQDGETISFRENHKTTKNQCQKLHFEPVPGSDTAQFTVTTSGETPSCHRDPRWVPAPGELLAGAQVKVSLDILETSW